MGGVGQTGIHIEIGRVRGNAVPEAVGRVRGPDDVFPVRRCARVVPSVAPGTLIEDIRENRRRIVTPADGQRVLAHPDEGIVADVESRDVMGPEPSERLSLIAFVSQDNVVHEPHVLVIASALSLRMNGLRVVAENVPLDGNVAEHRA